jgi:hypothetical protein
MVPGWPAPSAISASLLARVFSISPAGAWLGPPNHMAPSPATVTWAALSWS